MNAWPIQSQWGIATTVIASEHQGAPMLQLLVPASAVSITGEVKYYDVTGDSGGIVSRGFCPTCGADCLASRPPGTVSSVSW